MNQTSRRENSFGCNSDPGRPSSHLAESSDHRRGSDEPPMSSVRTDTRKRSESTLEQHEGMGRLAHERE